MAGVNRSNDQAPRRAYRSPKRANDAVTTRRRIRASAEKLFLRDGYAPTTMVKIAAEAGVAEKTVYLAYPSKAALLNEIIRVGVRGDDTDPPLARRDAWNAMLSSESIEQLLARAAAGSAQLLERAAHVLSLGEACATSDPQLAELRNRAHANIRADMREIATELHARHALAPGLDIDRASDILFAFVANESPYLRLTDECQWTSLEYTQLIHSLVRALLTAPHAG